ncbi:Retrovirus-related Pol polyprotein from transposon TNT 1-94 [Vitis vinifera]|uniref:Retrovirus-related Pol polyprotein from transposon TNT 1-94 n=1 Tax=Vitis vinifera TaxID=29760 RepID=A0A438JEV5_VITVI|nr:Retrovirus-related Pol polyprotein from transposon TNT 1-94 [Vitis vinifera]
MKAEEWALLDRQILGVIRLTLSSWKAMRMAASNSTGKEKLKYNDIQDLILAEEILRRDASETSGSSFALNLETRGKDQANKYNVGTVGKQVTLEGNAKVLRRRMKMILLMCNRRGDFGKVYLAYGSALDVVGLGDVRILLPNGSIWLLEKVTKGARVLARGKKTGTLYMTSCPKDTIASTDTSLWHRRLGHMNNGGEYIDGGFNEYCVAQGIRMEKTIPRTPQQNGVAERMNRTLNERARSMRLHAGLPKTFWANAVSTVAYLINQGPSVPMEFRLPKEVWSGKEVKFSHLKVFSCVSYVHIDSDARSKLDAKSKICFFIGYGDEKFRYRFWDEQNKKIIRSRNMIFNEQVMYKDRSTVVSDVTEIDQKKFKFVNLDELIESTVQKGGEEDKENVNSQVDLSTPVTEVRRSSKNIRPPQRYSPVLKSLLLTDGGEPKCYDEALQDESSSKWELAMKDEMDSLLGIKHGS